MSKAHPIVAVTGSSGAGTTTVKLAFSDVFRRRDINAFFVEGDGFLRYGRDETQQRIAQSLHNGQPVSHFGPELNDFPRLEALFKEYGERGSGQVRHYVTEENAANFTQPPGGFTPWESIPDDAELLLYEGLHGGVMARRWTRRSMSPSHNPRVIERRKAQEDNGVDVAQYVDLLIGVAPVMNLEWIQKIHSDTTLKGYSTEAVTENILSRMRDYIHFMVPQFSVTDINFQRIPIVDTSNPFVARDVPTPTESMIVIRFRDPAKYDFPYLMRKIDSAYMSRPNTMVIPGGYLRHALEVICGPLIYELCGK